MRWASISSVAIKDKEFEIVTEKAQDDAITHARETGDYGELDLVHVPETDVGDCDFMARAGKRLIEGGTWRDTPMAQGAIKAIQADPDYWGVSIKFVYDPAKFDGEKYHGNIRIRKRSILPQEMAASFGTKLVAMTGGDSSMKDEMSKDTHDALEKLNVSEDEIEELAEKQKAAEPEPNTVEKEAETPEPAVATVEVKKSVWERLKDAAQNLFTDADVEPDAGTGGVENVEEVKEEPVEAQDEKEAQPDVEMYKALAQAISAPLIAKLSEMSAELESVKGRLAEAESAVETKVLNRLAEIPPVVKVRASEVEATVVEDEKPQGHILPQTKPEADNYVPDLVGSINEAVDAVVKHAVPKAQI